MDSRQLQKASLTFAASPIPFSNHAKSVALAATNIMIMHAPSDALTHRACYPTIAALPAVT